MREIKFRAYCEGKQYDVADISFTKRGRLDLVRIAGESEYWNVNEIVIVEYTGLKDKNGKEIYEGDILRFVYYYEHGQWGENKSFTEVVNWKKLYCGFSPMYGTGEYEMPRKHYEVIGNIYENPELLEREK